MEPLSKQQIVASGSPWVAVVLNLVPGLGTGYIYQRRWKAYWITSAVAGAWLVAGALQAEGLDPVLMADQVQRNQLIGLGGVLVIALVTAGEAYLAAARAQLET